MSRRSSTPATAGTESHCCAETQRPRQDQSHASNRRTSRRRWPARARAAPERNAMKKNILVSVDPGETRVAVLEAKGQPSRRSKNKKAAPGGQGWKVAELYVERRGKRS